jgi:Calpain family cysteine protease
VDNLFYSLNQEIEIISLSKLHHPQIPTLLPKSID